MPTLDKLLAILGKDKCKKGEGIIGKVWERKKPL